MIIDTDMQLITINGQQFTFEFFENVFGYMLISGNQVVAEYDDEGKLLSMNINVGNPVDLVCPDCMADLKYENRKLTLVKHHS